MPTHPCLYCSDVSRVRTSEHVLERGLGANMTLPEDVCDHCNSVVFSPMDGHLINLVRRLVYWDHPHLVGAKRTILQDLGLMLDPQENAWVTIRLDKNYAPVVLTQIIFFGEANVGIFLDANLGAPWSDQLDQMKRELATPGALTISRRVIPGDLGAGLPALQPALIRSSRNTYVIRAPDDERAAKIESIVMSGALGTGTVTAERRGQSREMAQMNISFAIGDIERAVAKTALNYVCHVAGPDVARRPAFDAIRTFALTGTGEGFVSFLFGEEIDPTFAAMAAKFVKTGHHTLVVENAGGHPMVLIVLYERPFAVIRLAPGGAFGALPPDPLTVTLFDYRDRTHEIVRLVDDVIGFARRFDLMPP